MVNSNPPPELVPRSVVAVIAVYIALMVATVAVLAVFTVTQPRLATSEAWGHAVVVAVFAGVLTLRLRAAKGGDRSAVRAMTIIAAVLVVVNLVEAALPGVFPGWMRIEMVAVAALMSNVVALLVRARRASRGPGRPGVAPLP